MRILTLLFSVSTVSLYAQLNDLGTSFNSEYIKITNQDTVYAGNYRSYDDGETWTEIFNGTGSLDNYFSSSTAVVERNDTLFKTTDYGATWSQVAIIPNVSDIQYSTDEDVLYAYTNTTYLDGTITKPVSRLMKSSNGGLTWSEMTLPFETLMGDSLNCSAMDILNKDTIYFALRAAGPSFDLPAYLFRSYDGGVNWDTLNFNYHKVSTLEMVTTEVGYYSAFNTLYKTTDGGVTWLANELCPEIKSVKFVDEQVGFVTGLDWYDCPETAYRTTNGGATWEPLTVCDACSGANYGGWAIDALNANYAYTSGPVCDEVYNYYGLTCVELSAENELPTQINLYPNPVQDNGILKVENLTNNNMNYFIYSIDGQLVENGMLTLGVNYLDVNMNSGTYILQTKSESAIQQVQFTVY